MKGQKIWIALLVIALLFTSFPGIARAEKDSEDGKSSENSDLPTMLSDGEYLILEKAADFDEFRDRLQKCMEAYQENFAIEYSGDFPEVLEDWLRADMDNFGRSGMFFCGTEYWQWLAFCEISDFDVMPKGENRLFRFNMVYCQTAEEEKKLDEMISVALYRLVYEPEMTNYEKVTAVHDYIVLTKSVETYTLNPGPYHLMLEGVSIRPNYALLGYKMLKALGFSVKMIVGETSYDAWLKVKLDGEWYNLDMYEDEDDSEDKNSRSYMKKYRLVSDARFNETHPEQNWGIMDYPDATSTKYDAENDGSKVTLSEWELQRFLTRGADMYDDAYFRGKCVEVGDPYESIGENRREFRITFNDEVDEDAFSKIRLYRRKEDGYLEEMKFVRTVKGNVAVLTAPGDGSFPYGVYYIFVNEGILSPSGRVSKKAYFRKMSLRP